MVLGKTVTSSKDRTDGEMADLQRRLTDSPGFTLIELLVSLGVAGVLVALAIPDFRQLIYSNQLASRSNRLIGSLQAARLDAINSNQRITVCASTDGSSCSGTKDWSSGWLVFSDLDNDGAVDSGEPVLNQVEADDHLVAPANQSRFAFSPDGTLHGVTNGTVTLCKATAQLDDNIRKVVISSAGRARVETSHGDC